MVRAQRYRSSLCAIQLAGLGALGCKKRIEHCFQEFFGKTERS